LAPFINDEVITDRGWCKCRFEERSEGAPQDFWVGLGFRNFWDLEFGEFWVAVPVL
jgi:hypothetical protein